MRNLYLLGVLAASAAAGHAQSPQDAERRGIAKLGQTTVFDSTFNPAVSMIADFVLSETDRPDNFESYNQFNLRDAELGLVGRVDPHVSYQLYVAFGVEEIELCEGYLLADNWLPGTYSLKAGRFNSDFGKLSAVHDHDLPFVDKPQVLQEYLGGALRGTGLELHHNFGAGDSTVVRWSVGIANELDGDSHAIFGPAAGHDHHEDEEGPEPFGDRDLENFAFTGRLTSLTDVGENSTLQLGVSVAHAPEARQFIESGSSVVSADLEATVMGVDLAYKSLNPATATGFTFGAEALRSTREDSDDGVAIAETKSNGFYAYIERVAGASWSFGISGGSYEHGEDSDEKSTDVGVFVTHRVNEFNRLRFEARQFDDPDDQESYGILLQWTVIVGAHGHGLDW